MGAKRSRVHISRIWPERISRMRRAALIRPTAHGVARLSNTTCCDAGALFGMGGGTVVSPVSQIIQIAYALHRRAVAKERAGDEYDDEGNDR